jgi:hypothetical protein
VNLTLLISGLFLASGLLLGSGVRGVYSEREIAQIKRDIAEQKASTAAAALARLQAAQVRGDALEKRLNAAEQTRQTTSQETQRELSRLTFGRPCLAGAAVRLLNQSSATGQPGRLSAPGGSALAADAAFASDTDLAFWIDAAGNAYGTCRDRLQALIDWHAEKEMP